MKLNRKSINNYTYYFIIAFIVFSGFTDLYFVWHVIILGVFLLVVLMNSPVLKRKKNNRVLFWLGMMVILFIMSLIFSSNLSAASYNIRSSLYSLCGIGILYILGLEDSNWLYKKTFKIIKFLNIILIINIIVLYIQTRGTGFLIRGSWLAANPYYEDHCAGLFGFNATNVLGLYSIFVMMVNLSYIRENPKRRKTVIFITLLSQGLMAYLSQYNDNTGFYMLLVIFLIVYAYTTITSNPKYVSRLFSIIKYILLILFLLIIALNLPVLGDYIRVTVFDKIQRVLFYESFGGASGGSERLAIIRYAFRLDSTWKLGTGVGATQWIQTQTFGFRHFGIDSMGAYLMLGGIWFYIAYTMLYSEIYYSLFATSRAYRKVLMRIVIILIVVVFTLYTTIFNDARTAILTGMIAIVIKPMLTPLTNKQMSKGKPIENSVMK